MNYRNLSDEQRRSRNDRLYALRLQGMTLRDIAAMVGLSHEQVRQILFRVEGDNKAKERALMLNHSKFGLEDAPLEHFNLSVRLHNCLRNKNITSMREAFMIDDSALLKTPNFGRTSLTELRGICKKIFGAGSAQEAAMINQPPVLGGTKTMTPIESLEKRVSDLETLYLSLATKKDKKGPKQERKKSYRKQVIGIFSDGIYRGWQQVKIEMSKLYNRDVTDVAIRSALGFYAKNGLLRRVGYNCYTCNEAKQQKAA